MAGETPITIVGNIANDIELQYTQSGVAVANLRVASTPRVFDRNSGQYVDGEALFLSCNVWRDMAENVAYSCAKGMRVIVTGKLIQRSFDDREGNRRTVLEVDVDEIGPALRFATAQVVRSAPGEQQPQQQPRRSFGGFGN